MTIKQRFTLISEKLKLNWLLCLLFILTVTFGAIYASQGRILSASQPAQITELEVAGVLQEPRKKIQIVKVTPKTTAKKPVARSVAKKSTSPVPSSYKHPEIDKKPAGEVKPPSSIKVAMMSISGIGEFTVELREGENAFAMLQRVAADEDIFLAYEQYDFGKMLTQIGSLKAEGTYYWALYYNDAYAQVGAEELIVGENDKLEWRYESWAN